jgi:flagellar motor switch protein FliM
MPDEALTQDAIDRLLREIAEGKQPAIEAATTAEVPVINARQRHAAPATHSTAASVAQAATAHRRIRDYDFRRPNRISKEHMRGLRQIHEAFAREIPRMWGPLLRAGGQVKIVSMEQTIYDEYRNHLSPHSFICTVTLHPLEGEIAFQIDLDPSFFIVDRLLGGPGIGLKHARELTVLELNILQRVIAALLPTWREAWLPIIHLEPVISRTLSSTEFLQLTTLNESVLVTTLQARFLNIDIEMTICIPYTVVAPIIPRLATSETGIGQLGNDEIDRQRLTRQMRQMQLEVAARLGSAPIPIADLADLQVGDVIRLNVLTEGTATLHIGNRPYFVARPGLSNGNLAVQVTEIVRPE